MPLVHVESSEDTTMTRKTGDNNILHGMSRCRQIVLSLVLPLVVAGLLYSVTLTDDLFGDEFAQYRFSVVNYETHNSYYPLDVNTLFARIGYLLLGEPWAMRLHSLILSLGSIVLIWMVAKHCFDSRTATLAAWLAAFSPYLIEFATEARPNAIFIFAGILFLYALLRFIENNSWANTLLLIFSAYFGLQARPMFVAILLFGIIYHIVRQRRITFKLALVSLATVPLIIRMYYNMMELSNILPKASSDVPPSILNLLFRLPMAFTYGYCTLNYPERDAGWNISTGEVLLQNMTSVVVACIVFCALLVGFVQLLKKTKSQTVFLVGAVVLPILILLAVQETGFSMLNEKHFAGVAGAYYVLLAGIIVHISRFSWGKCAALLYACLVAVSLFHFYFQPEIYSRRSNYTALNSFLMDALKNDDLLMCYHWPSQNQPNPLTVLDGAGSFVDMYRDRPDGMYIGEYMASVDAACSGKIYLIYDSRTRRMTDSSNCVLPFLKKQRDFVVRRYGRNLSLYEFSEIHESKSQRP